MATVLVPEHPTDQHPRRTLLCRGVVIRQSNGKAVVRLERDGSFVTIDDPKQLIDWSTYVRRVVTTPPIASASTYDAEQTICIWRCEMNMEGLFSTVFWALGFLESQLDMPGICSGFSNPPARMIIDWTDEALPYHGGPGTEPANAWDAFFLQPPPTAVALTVDAAEEADAEPPCTAMVEAAAARGLLSITTRWGEPFFRKLGNFQGSEPAGTMEISGASTRKGGALQRETVEAGREAFARWLVVQPALVMRASAALEAMCAEHSLPPERWIGVHVRQTDRLRLRYGEAWRLSLPCLLEQALEAAATLRCAGTFIASDDAALKASLVDEVRRAGLKAASFEALLSAAPGVGSHQDPKLDRRRNAQDCVVESLIMARCAGLISTLSNVSVATVFFAKDDGYRHFLFDATAEPEPEEPSMC